MKRRLVVVWALIALPFAGTAAMGGPGGHLGGSGAAVGTLLPHALFHPIYIAFAGGAILVLLSLRSVTDSRAVRRLVIALVIAIAMVIIPGNSRVVRGAKREFISREQTRAR